MNEDNKEVWCLFRNNNGEWVSEAHVLVVCEEAAQTFEDLAGRCGATLSRQTSQGLIWFYRHELEKLEDSLMALQDTYTNVMNVEDFHQSLVRAERGSAEAQCQVGFFYLNGTGVKCDARKAIHWLKKSAMQGCADALFLLGYCYREGEGVQKKDWLAKIWMTKAAEQGSEISTMFTCEKESANVDDCLKAAERGDVDAQYSVGVCYYYGTVLPQDYGEAVHWLTKAAEQDDYDAQKLLMRCYLHGKGVPKDLDKAQTWLNKAREHRGKKKIPRP